MKSRKQFLSLFVGLVFCAHLISNDDSKKDSPGKPGNMVREIEIPATSVKNQYRTNTCWSFSTLSFLESEMLRKTGKRYNFSEMFIVRKVYIEKAKRFVRMHGNLTFAGGGEPNDVTDVIAKYGIMPESAYSGLKVDSANHIHYEMDAVLSDYVHTIIKNPDKKLTNVWLDGFISILDSYLGELPDTFTVDGTPYTARTYAEAIGIEPNDYVMLSSFAYQPYYSKFFLEVPDNWSWEKLYNVPLNELTEIVDYALENGYSATWSADVSEKGFNFQRGFAVAPKILYQPEDKEQEKQIDKESKDELTTGFFNTKSSVEELNVTASIRQAAFDDYSTQDDHGMHITGLAKDSNNREYYYVKNSWGTDNPFGGYLYVSKAYFEYKTISIMVNKEAIPDSIKEKLKI